jgi:hypothetical protein
MSRMRTSALRQVTKDGDVLDHDDDVARLGNTTSPSTSTAPLAYRASAAVTILGLHPVGI